MHKCTQCDELFSADQGEYNEDKEFFCAACADECGMEAEDEDDEDKDDDLDTKVKACPGCKEKTEDYAESGICPECGFEKDE